MFVPASASASATDIESVTGIERMGAVATPFRLDGEKAATNAKVTWTAVDGATRYQVLRSTTRGKGFDIIGETAGTAFDDYGLKVARTYHYRVVAIDGDGARIGESVAAAARTSAVPRKLRNYDNATPSSLAVPPLLQSDGVFYRYDFETDQNGFAQVVERTSRDGYTFSGDDVVLDRTSHPSLGAAKLESVNVRRHPVTGEFVMVAHYENSQDYALAQLLIAVATPGEDFEVTFNERPLGHESRDSTFFPDGETGYVVSSARNNSDLNVYTLTDDWSAVAALETTLFPGQHREAPALAKVDGHYYLFSSEAAGWYPSQARYASAPTMAGPWTELREIGNTSTFGAQSGGLVKVGKHYAMVANRWSANWRFPEAKNAGRLLPVSFNQGYASYDLFESVDYDAKRGILVPVQAGRNLSQGKPAVASSVSDEPGEAVLHAAEKANDGVDEDRDNYYKADAVPFTWEVDLGQASTLDRINLTTRLVNGSETYYNYTIEGSLDRKTYVPLADGRENRAVGYTSHEIRNEDSFRYVRIRVENVVNIHNLNDAAWAMGINELVVYGAQSGLVAPDTVSTPTVTVAGGTYYEPQTVGLTTTTPGAQIYYTLDGTDPTPSTAQLYTDPITVPASRTLKAYAIADELVDSAVLSQEYQILPASTPVQVNTAVETATYAGQAPQLPTEVDVTTASGETRSAPVEWDTADLTFARHYRTAQVTGVVDGVLAAHASVEVVPEGTVYFIDSGSHASTPSFRGVAGLVGEGLRNDTADQRATDGWGHVNDNNAHVGFRDGDITDKDETGLYAQGSSGTSRPIVYRLPLEAGTYTATAGFREWWNGPRQMHVTAVAPDGQQTVLSENVTVDWRDKSTDIDKTRIASGSFTTTTSGTVEIRVEIAGGTEAPVIGWLGVAQGEIPVDTTPTVVAAPTFEPAPGGYATPQHVTLAAAEGASIFYTIDGSVPSASHGVRYDVPFLVDETTRVRAVAVGDGVTSPVTTGTYTIEPAPDGGYTSVPVGRSWFDTRGNAIQAHGGGFLEHNGWYYWVGENKSHNGANLHAVSLYRSQDLVNWDFVNDIVTPRTTDVCQSGSYEGSSCKIERPKLVYNEATDQFVMWGHWETADSYAASHLIVATSPTIDGDYTVVRNFRPGAGHVHTEEADPTYTGDDELWGYGSRDFTVFKDPDSDDAYLVGSQDHLSMRLYKLTDDYTDVEWETSYPLFEGARREAPAVVKVGDRFTIITSAQSGWYPNQALYATTTDITDPDSWTGLRPVGNNTTFYSQPTNIMTVENTNGGREYVYMGDRWNRHALGSSTYVWLPLEIADDGAVTLDYRPAWSLDAANGTVSNPQPDLVSESQPVTAITADRAYAPAAANDGLAFNNNTSGDNTNYYKPAGVPFSWTVDLEETRDLDRVDLAWRAYNGSETYSEYTVSGSHDGLNWTVLADRRANRTVGFTSDQLEGEYRYVRVDVTRVVNDHNGNDAAWAAGLVEVQVYADPQRPGKGHSGGGKGDGVPARRGAARL